MVKNNNHQKGCHAERKDVISKTYMRTIRRYLWELFTNKYDIEDVPCNRPSEQLDNYVKDFFQEHFISSWEFIKNYSESKESLLLELLLILMTDNYSIKKKHPKMIRVRGLIKKAMKSYLIPTYTRLMKSEVFQEIVVLLTKSGLIDKMISSYPRLNESKQIYLEFNNSIISPYFKTRL